MRHYRDIFWKLTKDSKACKELGIFFKQDFCKFDREARAAVWPKMEQARAAGQNVYYRGHIGYVNGVRVLPELVVMRAPPAADQTKLPQAEMEKKKKKKKERNIET
ncbi:uncharacterized protein si:ch211-196c10.15 [Periophthalmus magnuspinnatus]|uniref:uncharacterized protein si:ch211-196c10.15 n=1 Tax=Periophthalmus magnuspinnatus TaxID=409849 RepID=UPI0024368A19|nr:uncharacterized protein si:ch211-196c10.15 [Periophthalmus magnuspinnatus]